PGLRSSRFLRPSSKIYHEARRCAPGSALREQLSEPGAQRRASCLHLRLTCKPRISEGFLRRRRCAALTLDGNNLLRGRILLHRYGLSHGGASTTDNGHSPLLSRLSSTDRVPGHKCRGLAVDIFNNVAEIDSRLIDRSIEWNRRRTTASVASS